MYTHNECKTYVNVLINEVLIETCFAHKQNGYASLYALLKSNRIGLCVWKQSLQNSLFLFRY